MFWFILKYGIVQIFVKIKYQIEGKFYRICHDLNSNTCQQVFECKHKYVNIAADKWQ